MTLIALDDVIFKIEVHVLNGMWLPSVDFFRNSATVQITSPKRARHLDEYTQNVLEEETRYDDVRSRRPVVWRRLHAVDATRVHQTRSLVLQRTGSDRIATRTAPNSEKSRISEVKAPQTPTFKIRDTEPDLAGRRRPKSR